MGIWPGTSTIYSSSNKENNNEINNNSYNLSTIEKQLFIKL
jgi:hypothetical protein